MRRRRDPSETGPAAVALRLLRAEEQRNKSTTPAHATPDAGKASSADEMAHQRLIYETAFELRVKNSSHVQAPSTWCLSSSSSSEVSVTPGRKGGIRRQPSLQDSCCPKPPLHQRSSCSTSASSSVQQQPAPTPRGFSSSVAVASSDSCYTAECRVWRSCKRQRPTRPIYQNHPLPRCLTSENPPVAPISAVAVKRSIHAGVKVRPSESVRRPRHGDLRNKGEPMALGTRSAQ
ncbi:hypothetical protein HPB49_007351 [Dermacentor silvarum]|uniref:Uncharacterized protein n=1 Tax=Dermacentor silvarum TaxID=543639 RepID=A0ACB8CW61_DERSI|nr:hypothetical protein HPB49_007351 [Dermacentor silvarum]